MPAVNTRYRQLSPEQLLRLERALNAFDRAWSEQAFDAQVPRLPPVGDPLRLPILIEMVKIDLEKHWGLGHRPCVEGYLSRYTELGTPQTVSPDLLLAEYEARKQFHDPVTLDDLAKRF